MQTTPRARTILFFHTVTYCGFGEVFLIVISFIGCLYSAGSGAISGLGFDTGLDKPPNFTPVIILLRHLLTT